MISKFNKGKKIHYKIIMFTLIFTFLELKLKGKLLVYEIWII